MRNPSAVVIGANDIAAGNPRRKGSIGSQRGINAGVCAAVIKVAVWLAVAVVISFHDVIAKNAAG